MMLSYHIDGGDFVRAGQASSNLKAVLKQLNIPGESIKRIVIAMYEAEINVAAHAYEGKVEVRINPDEVEIEVNDMGPGIENVELAMTEGYSTASQKVREMGFGAGMGLSNIKKNSDQFDLHSIVGSGTKLRIKNYINH